MYSRLFSRNSDRVLNPTISEPDEDNNPLFYSDQILEKSHKRLTKIVMIVGILNLVFLLGVVIFLSLQIGPLTHNIDDIDFHKIKTIVDSIDIKENNEDINKIKTKFTDKSLKVQFKVFNDEGKEVQKYYGEMKDGSALPEWIKVDPKTGKTKTNIPKGEKLVEFKIIAVDVDNNKKQVTVVIDPDKIAKDKEILKESRKTAKAKIMVNKDGSIKLKSINKDGSINKTGLYPQIHRNHNTHINTQLRDKYSKSVSNLLAKY